LFVIARTYRPTAEQVARKKGETGSAALTGLGAAEIARVAVGHGGASPSRAHGEPEREQGQASREDDGERPREQSQDAFSLYFDGLHSRKPKANFEPTRTPPPDRATSLFL
jgi:hypothetical protein